MSNISLIPPPDEKSIVERLASLETKIDLITQMLGDDIKKMEAQVEDHGRRIVSLENRQIWVAGWIAGAMALGAILEWVFRKM